MAAHARAIARMRGGTISLDLRWIAHGGRIFLVTGVVDGGYSDRHRAAFRRVAYRFRALRPDEREAIREARLRVVEAREGESLARLGSRSGNAWDVDVTATMNALAKDARLAWGQRVKIAVSRRYPGSRPAAASSPPPPRKARDEAALRTRRALASRCQVPPVGGSEPCPT